MKQLQTIRRQILAVALSALAVGAARAATVTVNATQPTGGSVYQTLREAVNAYSSWKNGADDTILVTDNGPNLVNQRIDFPRNLTTPLTVKNAPGDNPVLVIDSESLEIGIIVFDGTVTIDGLDFIGKSGILPSLIAGDTALNIQIPAPTNVYQTTIRNCRFVSNNGANAPETNPRYDAFNSHYGNFRIGIKVGGLSAPGTVRIEGCTLTHQSYNAIYYAPGPAGTHLIIDHCLISGTGEHSVLLSSGEGGNYQGTTVTLSNSGLFDTVNSGQRLYRLTTGAGGDFVIQDCILGADTGVGGSHVAVGLEPFSGNLIVRRCTFYGPTTGLLRAESLSSSARFLFEDLIFWHPSPQGGGMLFLPREETPTYVVNPGMAATPQSGAVDTGNQNIQDLVAALYGGTGPITADPQFARTSLTAADGQGRGWYSETNDLFDVPNPAYRGKGFNGADLSGGAQYIGPGPTSVGFWPVFR